VSSVATRILIHTYQFKTTNKTLPPLRIFISEPLTPFHGTLGFQKCSLTNIDIKEENNYSLILNQSHFYSMKYKARGFGKASLKAVLGMAE
jgi:hypothetical protein